MTEFFVRLTMSKFAHDIPHNKDILPNLKAVVQFMKFHARIAI